MSKMRILSRWKKGFTLIEILVVLSIIAIGASIAVPNLSGVISNQEMRTYQSYCMIANSYVKNYVFNLSSGVTEIMYIDKNKRSAVYTITDRSDFTSALNEYNNEDSYQYYVLAFASSFTSDPSSTIKNQITTGKLKKLDTIVVCIKKNKDSTYTLKGLWYYNCKLEKIVLTYFSSKVTVGGTTYKPGAYVQGRINLK